MLPLLLALLLSQTQPAVRRSTPASDDPGMVVRQAGPITISATIPSTDGGNIGNVTQGPGLTDGGSWAVTCLNCSGSGSGGEVIQGVAADGGLNWSVAPALATAAAPTYLEGATVPLSVDLSGTLRTSSGSGSSGTVIQGVAADGGLSWAVNQTHVGGTVIDTGSGATSAGTQRVVLSTDQPTVAVSAASLPLPTGASTAANQTTLGAQTTKLNDGTDTAQVSASGALLVDGSGVTQPVSGSVSVSGTVAATQSGTWTVRNQDGTGNALASSTTAPAGTEQALIVRNIPSGTQTVSGTVTTSGTVTSNQGTANTPANAWPTKLVDSAGTNVATVSAAGAVKVDGSAVTQPVSGTVTANIGTSGSLALDATLTGGTQRTRLTDGTNNAAVKAASTAAVAADPALVVAVSPNNTVAVTGTVTSNAGTGTFTVGQGTASNLRAQTSSEANTGAAAPTQGSLVMGNATTTAPTYTTATANALSLTTAGALRTDSSASTQPVSGTVAATQSGTWNVTNVSGTVSLPTGASTSALQTTGNTSLGNLDTKTPALGQTTMAGSSPVVIASNQSAVPVSGTFWQATQPVSAVSLPLPSGAATETTLSSRLSDSTFTGRFPASASLADATANPSLTASAGYLMAYNGTTWDRLRKSSAGLLVDIQNTTLAVTQSGTWNVGLSAGTNYVGKTRLTDGTLDVTLLNSAPGTDTGQVSVPVRIISSLASGAGGTSSSFTSAFPASGTAAGYNDGTNMQGARVYDTDTGAGSQYTLGANLRVSASGGSTEAAAGAGTTSASTLRVVLPTDQTSIPVTDNGGSLTVDGTVAVSGTVDTELPTAATLADATANPSTTSVGSLLLGYNGTTWDRLRATTSNGLLVDVSRIAAGTNYIGKTRLTDGTLDVSLLNSAPGSDTGQVAMPVRIISSLAGGAGGTSSSYGAAFPASGTASGFSDGTNMQSGRVFDADTGGGSQYVLGANLRVSASGGSTEAAAGAGATSASTLRVVLPTDQTAIPITDNSGSLTVDGTVAVSSVAGTVTVSGTVDTELPPAAALADATANPTTTSAGSLNLLYNGTTWDRMRGDTTNGLLVNVSDSFLLDATFTGRFSAAAAASDNFANPTTTGTLGFNMLWDGTTWDRAPGNSTDGTLVNLGTNNDVTVTGTVTANAGTGNFTVVQSTASSLRAQTASESATNAAIPSTAATTGWSDGTNVRIPRVTDLDTSGSTIWAPLSAVAGGGFGAPVVANVEGVAPTTAGTGLYVWSISKSVTNPVTSAVTCATTATAAPSSVLTYRTTLTVTNNSTVTIYLGGSAVTTSTGIPLLPGASFQDNVANSTYYCIVASGTADLRVLEN